MFWIPLLIGMTLSLIGALIAPKPKGQKPAEVSEMDAPTAEAGRPMTVIFGEITIKSPNYIGWWDKYYVQRQAKTKKK